MTEQTRKIVIIWLGVCAALIFLMVLLGGAVRLTESGLSMVDWKPLLGVIPPLTESAWGKAFDQYQRFPEYNLVNNQISLDQFKSIYLMEYAHRMMGRLIGIIFLIPCLGLILYRKIESTLSIKLLTLFAMGAIQGGIGWYMVKSGLVDDPSVSQYRLVLHLIVAVLIYTYMVRVMVGLLVRPTSNPTNPRTNVFGFILLATILIMICSGGFVAGTHAGFIYNTFPTMGGEWLPKQVDVLDPKWRNLFENPIMIQLIHRIMALFVLILTIGYASILLKRKQCRLNYLSVALFAVVMLQICLGVATLLLQVPVALGVAHQAGALTLLTLIVTAIYLQMPSITNYQYQNSP